MSYHFLQVLINYRFVDFAMHRVRMLQHFGVTPYLIFDGDYLPSKAATEADRSKRREESKKAGLDLLNAGKTSQAYLEFQKAVDVTPEMARQLIDDLKRAGVKYIVAPYEADPQMVYLETKGIIDGILSEDSDLLVFGAKCLLTKLDQYGNCIEINKADFCAVKEISLTGWSDVEFRRMAILSGCDYLAGINNMGLKTAYRVVRKHKTIEKIIRMMQFDGKFSVPKNYLEAYQRAELTFLHQRVFCPVEMRLTYHTHPEQELDDTIMPFLGAHVEPEIAQGVARGDLNPMTKHPIRHKPSTSSPFASNTTVFPQRAASFAEPSKKDKDIGSYFKGKRVPLAELDVNCFTPSPTQQDALRRNSGPWNASPLPRPYLNRSTTETGTQSRSFSTPNPTTRIPLSSSRSNIVTTPSLSGSRPTKRARLCEDTDIPTSSGQTGEVRSRFFAVSESSPSIAKTKGKRSRKSDDISIYTDNSVGEAILTMSVHDGIKIPNDISVAHEAVPIANEATLSQALTESQETSQDSLFTQAGFSCATNSSQNESTSQSDTSTVSPLSIQDLSARFTAKQAVSTPISVQHTHRSALPKPISVSTKPSRIPLAVKSNASVIKGGLTPLQRLAMGAGSKSRFPYTPPISPVTTALKPDEVTQRLRSVLKSNVPFPDVVDQATKLVYSQVAVDPAMIPLPPADEAENASLAKGNGSEDLIIHDSEEDEPLSPVESVFPKIDLSRFAFSN